MLLGNNKEIVTLRQVSCKTTKENRRMDHRPESVMTVIKLAAGIAQLAKDIIYILPL